MRSGGVADRGARAVHLFSQWPGAVETIGRGTREDAEDTGNREKLEQCDENAGDGGEDGRFLLERLAPGGLASEQEGLGIRAAATNLE